MVRAKDGKMRAAGASNSNSGSTMPARAATGEQWQMMSGTLGSVRRCVVQRQAGCAQTDATAMAVLNVQRHLSAC